MINGLIAISPNGVLTRPTAGNLTLSEGDTLRVYISFDYRAPEATTIHLHASVNNICWATKPCPLSPSPEFTTKYDVIDVLIIGSRPGTYSLTVTIEEHPDVASTIPDCITILAVGYALTARFESNHASDVEALEKANFQRVNESLTGGGFHVTPIDLPTSKLPILAALDQNSVLYFLGHSNPWMVQIDPTSLEPDARLTAIVAGRQLREGYKLTFINGCASLREVGPGSWAYELTKGVPGAVAIGWSKIEYTLETLQFADRFFECIQQGATAQEAFSAASSAYPVISRNAVMYTGTGVYIEHCYIHPYVPFGGRITILSGPYHRAFYGTFLCVPKGELLRLAATPLEGYEFEKWVVGGWDIAKDDYDYTFREEFSTSVIEIPASRDMSVWAWFRQVVPAGKCYTLNLSASPRGAAAISPFYGRSVLLEGKTVTVEVIPYSGYEFDHWEGVPWGDGTSTSSKLTITMTSDISLIAFLRRDATVLNRLVIWIRGLGYVATHMSSELTLVAHPYEGYRFDHWEDEDESILGTSPTTSLVLDRSRVITAFFVKDIETCLLEIGCRGSGTVTPASGLYPRDSVVDLVAHPSTGWRFDHWEGTDNNFVNPTTVTMREDRYVVAYFTTGVTPPPDLGAIIVIMLLLTVMATIGYTITQGAGH